MGSARSRPTCAASERASGRPTAALRRRCATTLPTLPPFWTPRAWTPAPQSDEHPSYDEDLRGHQARLGEQGRLAGRFGMGRVGVNAAEGHTGEYLRASVREHYRGIDAEAFADAHQARAGRETLLPRLASLAVPALVVAGEPTRSCRRRGCWRTPFRTGGWSRWKAADRGRRSWRHAPSRGRWAPSSAMYAGQGPPKYRAGNINASCYFCDNELYDAVQEREQSIGRDGARVDLERQATDPRPVFRGVCYAVPGRSRPPNASRHRRRSLGYCRDTHCVGEFRPHRDYVSRRRNGAHRSREDRNRGYRREAGSAL